MDGIASCGCGYVCLCAYISQIMTRHILCCGREQWHRGWGSTTACGFHIRLLTSLWRSTRLYLTCIIRQQEARDEMTLQRHDMIQHIMAIDHNAALHNIMTHGMRWHNYDTATHTIWSLWSPFSHIQHYTQDMIMNVCGTGESVCLASFVIRLMNIK